MDCGHGKLAHCPTPADAKAGLLSSGMAVVVAKSLEAYGGADFDKARFFAMMFFVIGLCSIVVYATIGWISNLIAQ
ncbi:hypothetical protein E4U53_001081, partial [Claviceps sorghi]